MRNLTLKVDDNVLARVRRYAATHGTSVNALVREYLAEIADRENRAQKARRRILELSRRSSGRVGRMSWNRDELHER